MMKLNARISKVDLRGRANIVPSEGGASGNYQVKTIHPSHEYRIIRPDEDFDALAYVQVVEVPKLPVCETSVELHNYGQIVEQIEGQEYSGVWGMLNYGFFAIDTRINYVFPVTKGTKYTITVEEIGSYLVVGNSNVDPATVTGNLSTSGIITDFATKSGIKPGTTYEYTPTRDGWYVMCTADVKPKVRVEVVTMGILPD